MSLNPKYTRLWAPWLALTIVTFFAIEIPAIVDPAAGDTLTEHLFEWLGLSSRNQWVGRAALAVFLAWLTHHFMRPRKRR